MNDESNRALPPELDDVAARLRASRDELSGMELDSVRQRVLRTALHTPSRRSTFMKSRLAVTAMLVLGMLFSTAGASLAVQGATGDETPSGVQYRQSDDSQQVLGEVGEVDSAPSADSAPAATPPAPEAQPTAPQESSGELPFTGFLAIPILIGGVALLSTGLVLRRRTGEQDDVS
jgi:hypothetical protein